MNIRKILRDKRLWVVIIAIFVLLLTFFDRNNLFDRAKLKGQINELEHQRNYYLNKIAEDSTLIERLKDDEFLERYARENYLMKRDSDFVYIIIKE